MRSDMYKKQLMIYLGGYATWKPFTLDEWFYARDYVNEHKQFAYKV